jgi:hypothetical protein
MQDAFWNPGIYYTVSHTQVVIFALGNSVFFLAALLLQELSHRRERRDLSKVLIAELLRVSADLLGKQPSESKPLPDAGIEPASDAMLDVVAEAVAHVDENLDVRRVRRRQFRGKKP